MSLIVHHLNNSRSQRILWLLEEIGAPYEIRYYDRDPVTNLAPPELIAVHPLGKSPVIEDFDDSASSGRGRVIIESGAITEYLCERHGGELSVVSEVGKGSTFALVFPASRVRAASDGSGLAAPVKLTSIAP